MERYKIESVKFEFWQDTPNSYWVLFARFDGIIYICLTPFRFKMDAKDYIIEAIDHFTGRSHLEHEWQIVWSDEPTFVEAQLHENFEEVSNAALDVLPL